MSTDILFHLNKNLEKCYFVGENSVSGNIEEMKKLKWLGYSFNLLE